MQQEIRTITLPLFFGLGDVNCYLVEAGGGCVLIDTGTSTGRTDLEEQLKRAGCGPGRLPLVVLTHGDFDHTGNAAYLRERFGARIAMHHGDAGMVERGDLFWSREMGNALLGWMTRPLFGFGEGEKFKPDLLLDDGYDLSEYGLDARVVHIPGHSAGSIGILTAEGDLFCGDLFTNRGRPRLNSIIDDPAAARASIEKLRGLGIQTVYPAHGKPFPMEQFEAEALR